MTIINIQQHTNPLHKEKTVSIVSTIVLTCQRPKPNTATLEVVIPPDIINEETSGDMMVPEGGSAKLVCRARGHPKPKIIWRREDGREIIARNGVHQKTKAISVEGEMLTLSKVTRSEMGAYMCIASNGVPPTVSKRMKLQVHSIYNLPFKF
ncbi:hypothetical protein ACLKA6_017029 [Drosophila palustris]